MALGPGRNFRGTRGAARCCHGPFTICSAASIGPGHMSCSHDHCGGSSRMRHRRWLQFHSHLHGNAKRPRHNYCDWDLGNDDDLHFTGYNGSVVRRRDSILFRLSWLSPLLLRTSHKYRSRLCFLRPLWAKVRIFTKQTAACRITLITYGSRSDQRTQCIFREIWRKRAS